MENWDQLAEKTKARRKPGRYLKRSRKLSSVFSLLFFIAAQDLFPV